MRAYAERKKVPSSVHDVIRRPGKPLSKTTRAYFEPRFGYDFSQVRIHDGADASQATSSLNATAFTVGRNVVFDRHQYQPETNRGRELLAHELTHVIQQEGANQSGDLHVRPPGDTFEQQADATANQVLRGKDASGPFLNSPPSVQRESPQGDTKKEEEKDTGEIVAEGMKTVAEQAKDNNPAVKKILDNLESKLKLKWEGLHPAEKAAMASWGVGTIGMLGTAFLSDPSGRKHLEEVNLATPLKIIPKMPLDTFKYTLPTGDSPTERLVNFETGFDASDLLNMYTERYGLAKMSLKVNMRWAVDPATKQLLIQGGDASIGIVPGLTVSGGLYKDILRQPETHLGPEGQLKQVKERLPEPTKPKAIPDARVMVTVDLMKFKPSDLVRLFRR